MSFQRAFEDSQRWAATDRVRQTVLWYRVRSDGRREFQILRAATLKLRVSNDMRTNRAERRVWNDRLARMNVGRLVGKSEKYGR